MKKSGKFFRSKYFLFFLPVILIVFFDQLSKILVKSSFNLGESISFGIFELTYIQNTGAGFGLLRGFNLVLVFVSVLVLGAIIYYYHNKIKVKEKLVLFSSAFVFGGTLGNLIDRVAYGFVVDFINFPYWPAFNIADMAISAGVVGLVIYFWKK